MARSQTMIHERLLLEQQQQQQQGSPAGSEWRDHDRPVPMRKVDQCITFRLPSIHHVYMCKKRCMQHQNGH